MNLRNYLIKISLILFISFSFTEKTLSVEPSQFIQSVVDEASQVLVTNITKEEKMDRRQTHFLAFLQLLDILQKHIDLCSRYNDL